MPRPMTRAQIEIFYKRLRKERPKPRIELDYTNPYTLLVAVVLSAQSTDKGVNKATPALFRRADTAAKMLRLGEEKLRDYIKTIGLFRTKARNIISLSAKLCEDHGGEVPSEREALEGLAGVGRKSANVILNSIFGEATIAVDTHIFRVANRTGLGAGKTPLEVEKALLRRTPGVFLQNAHHWLVLHGRYVCKAKKPECFVCPVEEVCMYGEKVSAP